MITSSGRLLMGLVVPEFVLSFFDPLLYILAAFLGCLEGRKDRKARRMQQLACWCPQVQSCDTER